MADEYEPPARSYSPSAQEPNVDEMGDYHRPDFDHEFEGYGSEQV